MKIKTEYEAKFYPVNKEGVRKKLDKLGAKLLVRERKMKRAIADQKAYPQLPCDYIRVRDEGGIVRISAKWHARKSGKLSDQEELDFEISSFDKAVKLLEIMGFKPNRYQETLRETWKYKGTEIVIDTWPGLKPYVEIEGKSEKDIKKVAQELGFDWSQKKITSIVEIYSEIYKISPDKVLGKISQITFENNPFSKN